jgi:hypothetical protein
VSSRARPVVHHGASDWSGTDFDSDDAGYDWVTWCDLRVHIIDLHMRRDIREVTCLVCLANPYPYNKEKL